MERFQIRTLALSFKMFVGLFLCVMGLSYLTLLGSIWIDTEMKISFIIEGYGLFESMELVEHSFKYIFWFIGIFGIMGFVFMMTSYPETLKRIFAVIVPLLIVSDVSSMWFIRFSNFFAWQLYVSGFLLAGSFLVMFLLIQYDLWSKAKEGE